MRATIPWVGGVLVTSLAAALAHAGNPYFQPDRRVPDMSGPGYYVVNQYGAVYGPCYNLTPPFPPFQGIMPPFKVPKKTPDPPQPATPGGYVGSAGGIPGYPTPYGAGQAANHAPVPPYGGMPPPAPPYPQGYAPGPGLWPSYPRTDGPGAAPYHAPQGPMMPPAAGAYQPGGAALAGYPATSWSGYAPADDVEQAQNLVNPPGRNPAAAAPQVPMPIYPPGVGPGTPGVPGTPPSPTASAPRYFGPAGPGPGQGGQAGPPPIPIFPTHPFARSPRDYFEQ